MRAQRPDVLNISSPPVSRLDQRTVHQPFTENAEPTWRDAAVCREWTGVDFFPFSEDIQAIRRVKEVCALCPVTEDCLSYAIETRQGDGVWGGLTAKERIYLRRKWMEHTRAIAETTREIASAREGSRQREKSSS